MVSPLRRPLACIAAGTLVCGTLAAAEPYRIAQRATPPASSTLLDDTYRRPTSRGNSDAQCQQRWQAYLDSQACFAPYLTVNGIKPEAFQACGAQLPDPSADCGPPKEAWLP